MQRIPVHVVTGASTSDRTQLIARLCRERTGWIGLVGADAGAEHPYLQVLPAGCPCCTGKIVLQISLARALRGRAAVRAFVELADPAHAGMLEKALCEAPLNVAVRPAQTFVLPEAARLTADQVEADS